MAISIDEIYEQAFKSQPLYANKFHIDAAERQFYMNQVADWMKKWQAELDKLYLDSIVKAA